MRDGLDLSDQDGGLNEWLNLDHKVRERFFWKQWEKSNGKKQTKIDKQLAYAKRPEPETGLIAWIKRKIKQRRMSRDFAFIMKEAEAGRLPR